MDPVVLRAGRVGANSHPVATRLVDPHPVPEDRAVARRSIEVDARLQLVVVGHPRVGQALEAGAVELVGRVQLTLADHGVVRLDKQRVPLELMTP